MWKLEVQIVSDSPLKVAQTPRCSKENDGTLMQRWVPLWCCTCWCPIRKSWWTATTGQAYTHILQFEAWTCFGPGSKWWKKVTKKSKHRNLKFPLEVTDHWVPTTFLIVSHSQDHNTVDVDKMLPLEKLTSSHFPQIPGPSTWNSWAIHRLPSQHLANQIDGRGDPDTARS